LWIILALAVLIAAGAGVLIWARGQVAPDRVLPGALVFGSDAQGWTRDQVRNALWTKGYGAQAGKVFTLSLPGEALTVPLEDLGLVPDLEGETEAVMAWGHTGNRSLDALNWLFERNGIANFPRETELTLEEGPLTALCDRAAELLDREPVQTVVFADAQGLGVTLGTSGAKVDKAALLETMRDALHERRYRVEYAPETVPPEPLDLEEFWRTFHMEPKNAVFDETYQVRPEETGRTFDLEEARAKLAAAGEGEEIRFPLIVLEPEVTAAELEGLLFRDLLAAIDTPLTNNAVRTKNIEIAASRLNDTILLPGQNFSYNAALGERTEEKGYGPATAYVNGDLVEEVGGGICQLSSALYWCAMKADEVILERENHRYYQTYVPYGMDATVSWGGPDFSFKLKDEYPVRMKAWIEDGQLKVELWGTRTEETRVELEYEVNEVYPVEVLYLENKNVKPGTQVILDYGREGMRVTTYRLRYDGEGNLLEKVQEAVSVYEMREKEIIIAPGEKP
jgi:vancomycin resistance protein YoaR